MFICIGYTAMGQRLRRGAIKGQIYGTAKKVSRRNLSNIGGHAAGSMKPQIPESTEPERTRFTVECRTLPKRWVLRKEKTRPLVLHH